MLRRASTGDEMMASSEGCSPYALTVGILIGIFIGREDNPETAQVCVHLPVVGEFQKYGPVACIASPCSWSSAVLPALGRLIFELLKG